MDRLPDRVSVFAAFCALQFLLVPTVATGAAGQHATATGGPSGALPAAADPVADRNLSHASNPCVGTVEQPPARTTLLTIQGARGDEKTVPMLVGIHPNGSVAGLYNGSAADRWWFYDVDPLANGNLLLSTTKPGSSIVEEIDPVTGDRVSIREFPDVLDSHDADLIRGEELLLNDMSQDGAARIFVYNLTTEAVTWEYRFDEHPDQFPREGGGEYGGDWTHNNDVERIRPGVFVVSVRNFDQVVAIDRSTKELVWRLGADDDHSVLYEQHNPDYLLGENGRPTVIVADSENDRVVEYAREDGAWNRTWVLRGGGLNEPRDADRLPNGNTLVADRRGDRLLEVTPDGTVVWEFYAPWQPYDAERLGTGDESSGPTARQLNATGVHEVTGSAGVDASRAQRCYEFLTGLEDDRRLVPRPESTATTPSAAGTQMTPSAAQTPTTPPAGGTAVTGRSNESALGTPPGGVLPSGTAPLIGAIALVCLFAGAIAVAIHRAR